MTDAAATIAAAERRATQARERLSGDLQKLQLKLNPKTLAREAARSAADKGQSAAEDGLEYAKANPAPIAGAVAVAGLFLFRKRIARLFRRKQAVPAQAKSHDKPRSDEGNHQ